MNSQNAGQTVQNDICFSLYMDNHRFSRINPTLSTAALQHNASGTQQCISNVFILETNELPSKSDTFSSTNVTLARAYSTCAPARCIWEAQPTGAGICRFSGQGWARSRLWQCQSFAGGGDRPRRSAGTCHPSSVCSAPYRHPSGCYSILNRSKTHLAVKLRSRKIHEESGKHAMNLHFNKTCWGDECRCVQKSGSGC